MIAVVQRVTEAAVNVPAGGYRAEIGLGLLALVCAEERDGENEAKWLAKKIANLRVFADDDGRMNRSVRDVGGAVLVVSQFTLAGDCRKGNRPSFVAAADPKLAEHLCDLVGQLLEDAGLPVATGKFGAMMKVSLVNDGPVTLIVRTP